jgi:hypothetical protein
LSTIKYSNENNKSASVEMTCRCGNKVSVVLKDGQSLTCSKCKRQYLAHWVGMVVGEVVVRGVGFREE